MMGGRGDLSGLDEAASMEVDHGGCVLGGLGHWSLLCCLRGWMLTRNPVLPHRRLASTGTGSRWADRSVLLVETKLPPRVLNLGDGIGGEVLVLRSWRDSTVRIWVRNPTTLEQWLWTRSLESCAGWIPFRAVIQDPPLAVCMATVSLVLWWFGTPVPECSFSVHACGGLMMFGGRRSSRCRSTHL